MNAPINFGTNIFHLIRILISYNLTQSLQHFDGAGDHKANIECDLNYRVGTATRTLWVTHNNDYLLAKKNQKSFLCMNS